MHHKIVDRDVKPQTHIVQQQPSFDMSACLGDRLEHWISIVIGTVSNCKSVGIQTVTGMN